MNTTHKLLLFDIDGTIVLYKDKFPRKLFEEMIEVFFYKKISLAEYRFSGKTDKAIIADMIGIAGIWTKRKSNAVSPRGRSTPSALSLLSRERLDLKTGCGDRLNSKTSSWTTWCF